MIRAKVKVEAMDGRRLGKTKHTILYHTKSDHTKSERGGERFFAPTCFSVGMDGWRVSTYILPFSGRKLNRGCLA